MRRCIPLLVAGLAASACTDPAPPTGAMVVNISGLPSGANAFVRITGPDSYFRTLNATATLEGLVPGEYVVRMDTILHQATKYGVASIRDTVDVTKGATVAIDVPYIVSSGSLDLSISGLPSGIPAQVMLTKGNITTILTASGLVTGLAPGKYDIVTDTFFTVDGDRFAAARVLDSVTIVASTTPAAAVVAYTMISSTLALSVPGLPGAVAFDPIVVEGPDGFRATYRSSSVLRGLDPGTYKVSAVTAVGTCPTVYRPDVSTIIADIPRGETATAAITFTQGTADAADLNLRISRVQVTQVSQDAAGSVPMIAGRRALVRVYATANQCNSVRPQARLTINGVQQPMIEAPEASVRYQTDEGTLESSWNYIIPAALVVPGMSLVAELDPANAIAEPDESDNRFPSSGVRVVPVATVPTIGITFVPLTQPNGLTGTVTGNENAFLNQPRRMLPFAQLDVAVRAPLTVSFTLVGSGANAFPTWSQALSELDAARTADQSTRYYYGVPKLSYTFGTVGIAYSSCAFEDCKAAMGTDDLQVASAVMTHEVGHNLGRAHAPCGVPASDRDSNYPTTGLYAGGYIGVFGFDVEANLLKNPTVYTDIMGYCFNGPQWVSDYTFRGMLEYLSSSERAPALASIGGTGSQPSLLIWGRIENGLPVLEPAFEIDSRPVMPASRGPSQITAFDADGTALFSFSFQGNRVADLPGDHEGFSFAVPLSLLRGRSIASLRLSARGRTSTNVASVGVDADPGVVATRPGAGRVRLRWDASRFPVLMVRDRATRDVIAFARGGDATVAANQDEIEVNASNRIGSARRTVRILK